MYFTLKGVPLMSLILLNTHRSTSYNKNVDTYYVYEVSVYLDSETNTKSTKRVVVGKLDRETGEIIPTRKKKTVSPEQAEQQNKYQKLYEQEKTASQEQFQASRSAMMKMAETMKSISDKLERLAGEAMEESNNIKKLLKTFDL